MGGVEDHTRVTQDYLKVIWSAVEWGDPPITTKGLADRFGTTQANVSETLRRLHARSLVIYQPYRPVTLTSRGEQLALQMVRRHRLIETFLTETLGYAWDEVHDEAERLEHSVSDKLVDRIDTLLGRPEADPHGDPIPAADGTRRHPPDVLKLSEAPPGRYRVVRVADDDPTRLVRLKATALLPGAVVQVRDDELRTVLIEPAPSAARPLNLDRTDLVAVRVTLTEDM